jgi:membrane protease YdiL (CAAX protease family)
VLALAAGLVAYSSTAQLIPAFNVLYVPLSLVATVALGVVASRVGLEPFDLGLERSTWRTGLLWGAGVAAVAAVSLALAVIVPAFHPLFDDARISGIGPGLLAYRALVRIPLGTALFEEFAFRGVLFGAWAKLASPAQAAAGSSLVFGLWHVRPTIELLDANDLAVSAVARGSVLAAAVLLTAAAGYLFCLLRVRSRSLIAPFVAHAAINSLTIVAAYVIGSGT